MEFERFDRLTRTFAGSASRRGVMRGLAALGVGSVLGPSRAGAQRASGISDQSGPTIEGIDESCKGNHAISNKSCTTNPCTSDCVCAVSSGGDKKCVRIGGGITCPVADECDRNRDCGTGEVCIKVGGCCNGRKFNQCLPHCV